MNNEKINLEIELQQQLDQSQERNAKLEELLNKVSMGILQGSDKTGQIINASEAINFIKENCFSNPLSIDKDKLVKDLESKVVFLEHQLNNAISEIQKRGSR
jgi:hypothetical protein